MFLSQSWLNKENHISNNITSLSYLWSPIKLLYNKINQTNLHKYIAFILYSAPQKRLLLQN